MPRGSVSLHEPAMAGRLGSPGPLDLAAGTIVRAGNLVGWDNFPLRDRVASHCGLPVAMPTTPTPPPTASFGWALAREHAAPQDCL
jgi:hypothetical protein